MIPNFIRNLTRFPDNDLTIQFLGDMWVVVNVGGGYVIPRENVKHQLEQPEELPQPRPRRRNVRVRGEMGRAQHDEGGIPTDRFQSWVGTYLDNLCGGVTYNTQILKGIYSDMHVVRPPTVPPQFPYIPTWEELWMPRGDGARTSGARED